nr:hypothetical protein HUO10_000077 [Paraburkholderia busanensis]
MGKQVRLELEQLHPTQVTAGMLEVDEKRKHFASLSPDELKRALSDAKIAQRQRHCLRCLVTVRRT